MISFTEKEQKRKHLYKTTNWATGYYRQHTLSTKWSWTGPTIRRRTENWTKLFIEWYPSECERKRGRPEYAWDEEMKKTCGGVTWPEEGKKEGWRRLADVYYKVQLKEETDFFMNNHDVIEKKN